MILASHSLNMTMDSVGSSSFENNFNSIQYYFQTKVTSKGKWNRSECRMYDTECLQA
jgi:hypothetical protein